MYKSKYLEKLIFILILGTSLLLSACGSEEAKEVSSGPGDGPKLKIGINQFMEHPALDDARKGFEDELEKLGGNIEIIYKNAQGDLPNSLTIAQKFVKEDVDLIYAIGTPAAQSTKQATEDIPILFSAVTDPVYAGLLEDWDRVDGNISGTSDMAPTREQLAIFNKLDPSIKKIGILYNTNEANSISQIDKVKELIGEFDLDLKVTGINNISEVAQATDHLLSNVDAIYILSDNMIASSVGLVSNKLIEKNMVSVSAEESQVGGGILITNGLSYYSLGGQTGRMAKKIMVDRVDIKDLPVELSEFNKVVVNKNTLQALGLDESNPIFKDAEMVGK